MSATITLSESEHRDFIKQARADFVREQMLAMRESGQTFDFIQSAQVCGLLNVAPRTLAALPLPRYPLPGGKTTFYKLSEVIAYLESKRER
jgi:hypothetical protein